MVLMVGRWAFTGVLLGILSCASPTEVTTGPDPVPMGFGAPDVPPAAPAPWIRLERTGCYGTCPVYQLQIDRQGQVQYHGDAYVRVVGDASKALGPDGVAALEAALRQFGFAEIPEDCCNCYDFTDAPSLGLSVVQGTTTKSITYYFGCRKAAPAVRLLAERIDAIVGAEDWVKAPAVKP